MNGARSVIMTHFFQKVQLKGLTMDETLQNGTLKACVSEIIHANRSWDNLVVLAYVSMCGKVEGVKKHWQTDAESLARQARSTYHAVFES